MWGENDKHQITDTKSIYGNLQDGTKTQMLQWWWSRIFRLKI